MKCKYCISFLILSLFMIITCFTDYLPHQVVKASAASEDISRAYLNSISKNLYLGIKGKNKFDFNINTDKMVDKATYRWYVAEDKGDSYAVTINSETGLVTARIAGTAYIGCVITLPNKKVLKPEAQVTVINNITEVAISNIPADRKLAVDSSMDFDHTVMKTAGGKNSLTKGIVRWEVANDTAGVGSVTDLGIVVPKQAGSFDIRVVCFQDIDDYNAWLMNKTARKDKITAASEWVTLTAVDLSGEAVTQEELKKLLTDENITQITLSANESQSMIIPEGDYSNKTLIIDAPNTSVENYGDFNMVIIKSADYTNWMEAGNNNSFHIYDSQMYINIVEDSQVGEIIFDTNRNTSDVNRGLTSAIDLINKSDLKDASNSYISLANTITLAVNGKVEDIRISAATKLVLSGIGSVNHLTVEKTADGTMLAMSNKTYLTSEADIIMSILRGAESTQVNLASDAYSEIENLTGGVVLIKYGAQSIISYNGFAYKISGGSCSSIGEISYSSVLKLPPSYTSPVTAASIPTGAGLGTSMLTGTFYYNSVPVDGMLTWAFPYLAIYESGYYQWIFIPADSKKYNIITGTALVNVIK